MGIVRFMILLRKDGRRVFLLGACEELPDRDRVVWFGGIAKW